MNIFADAATSSNWSNTINTWGLLGLGAIQGISILWGNRYRTKSLQKLTTVQSDIGDVKNEIKSVKRSVDGPMGTALQTAATALGIAAKAMPGDSDLILQAIAAQKKSDDHRENMKLVEEEARKDEMNKAKIISAWKSSQNPPIP